MELRISRTSGGGLWLYLTAPFTFEVKRCRLDGDVEQDTFANCAVRLSGPRGGGEADKKMQ
jgi:hypothetical protein